MQLPESAVDVHAARSPPTPRHAHRRLPNKLRQLLLQPLRMVIGLATATAEYLLDSLRIAQKGKDLPLPRGEHPYNLRCGRRSVHLFLGCDHSFFWGQLPFTSEVTCQLIGRGPTAGSSTTGKRATNTATSCPTSTDPAAAVSTARATATSEARSAGGGRRVVLDHLGIFTFRTPRAASTRSSSRPDQGSTDVPANRHRPAPASPSGTCSQASSAVSTSPNLRRSAPTQSCGPDRPTNTGSTSATTVPTIHHRWPAPTSWP